MGMGTGTEMGTGTGHASPRPAMPFPSKQCTTRANPISLCPSTKHGLEENPGKELVSLTALIPSAHPLQASCRWGPAPPITLLLPPGTWLSLTCVPPHFPCPWVLATVWGEPDSNTYKFTKKWPKSMGTIFIFFHSWGKNAYLWAFSIQEHPTQMHCSSLNS